MDALAATLGRALLDAMTMDVWHQVLRVFAESLAEDDPEAAAALKADLRATQRRLREDPDYGAPHVETEYLEAVTARVRGLLGEKPELEPVLTRILDRGIFSESPTGNPMRGESSGITIGFADVAGQVVTGGMTQNINRDQVRDA
ncbi:hypothetical protein K8Z49_29070 [Actinomadura madurae]|uniref:Uncharacterized protein n=1 Tax=Actinomadura madurae TaxID=1993 RepID=A0A1I5MI87_9ACTN|nr:hypothetical protein [Actinomadura madurae]SFP08666.1 hypothetical protein SAMN04489713_111287 [Actinomadura madurae]